jgi:putative inorganic carbon (HCO3(-)) transporter
MEGRITAQHTVQPERARETARHIPSGLNQARNWGTRLEETRPIWVAGLLPLFLLGEGRFAAIGLACVFVLWVWSGWSTGIWAGNPRANVCLLALFVLSPLTILVTPVAGLAREHLAYFVAELLACLTALTWVRDGRRAQTLAFALCAIGVVMAAASPLLIDRSGNAGTGQSLSGDLIQKNVLGGALAILCVLSLGIFIGKLTQRKTESRAGRSVIWSFVATAAMAAGLLYSGSRGALLGAVIGGMAMAILALRPLRWIAPIIAGLAAVAGVMLGPVAIVEGLLRGDTVGDFAVRQEIWSRALQIIRDFPLTGMGLGSFRLAAPALYPYEISDPARVHHAHNLLLQVGVDFGILGIAAITFLAGVVLVSSAQGWKRGLQVSDRQSAWIAAGCFGSVTALLSHGLVDAVTWDTRAAPLAWAVLGLALAMGSLRTGNAEITNDISR